MGQRLLYQLNFGILAGHCAEQLHLVLRRWQFFLQVLEILFLLDQQLVDTCDSKEAAGRPEVAHAANFLAKKGDGGN